MSAAPSEPEKYSIDEMMDRLKGPSSSNPNGELVTRDDGSQAIRIKKRKRRSTQPHKEDKERIRKARIVQVSAALVLVFGAAITVGAAVIYANSSPFRQGLEAKIKASSGADIELEQFRMNPQSANAGQLTLKWPEGNVMESLSLRNISAEIFPASFLGNTMSGEEVTAAEASLVLRVPHEGEPTRAVAAVQGTTSVRFNGYRVPKFNVLLGDSIKPALKIEGSEAILDPENVASRPQLSLYQGDLFIQGWPKLRLDRGFIEFNGSTARIHGLRMLHENEKDNRGSLEASGSIEPYKAGKLSSLDVKMQAFEISGLSGPVFGRLFSGRLDTKSSTTSNYFTFNPSESTSAILDVTFQPSSGTGLEIGGFSFLYILSQAFEDKWFERPQFDSSSNGVLHLEKGVFTVRNLDFENKGRMAVRGQISVSSSQNLSGTLEIGLPSATVGSTKIEKLKSVFGPPNDGFRWVKIQINGPASSPKDNFADMVAAGKSTESSEAEPSREGNPSTFEELTRPR